MTENEAKDILRIIGWNRAEEGDVEGCQALDMAIQALEEIQAYRKIELTPSMVKDLIASEKQAHKTALENADLLDEYQSIGLTMEVVQEIKRMDAEQGGEVLGIIASLKELGQYRAIGTVEELQKSVKEEDILKFYHIESEDKYVFGRRVGTMYYAEVGKTGLAFYMSRYLPWGEHVVAPDTLWKEHTYPSEPKEIPFFDWLQGFMKKEYGGTVEEFKALKEKSVAKAPKHITKVRDNEGYIGLIGKCPLCEEIVEEDTVYCDCGQALDWGE